MAIGVESGYGKLCCCVSVMTLLKKCFKLLLGSGGLGSGFGKCWCWLRPWSISGAGVGFGGVVFEKRVVCLESSMASGVGKCCCCVRCDVVGQWLERVTIGLESGFGKCCCCVSVVTLLTKCFKLFGKWGGRWVYKAIH